MKVTISRPELANLIGKIQSVVSSKPAIPILANVLIEAKNGILTISATDLTVSMRAQMEASVSEKGTITLPARRFFQLVRELTTPEIEISANTDEIAYVQAGTSQFRINGINSSEFPSFPDLNQGDHFEMTPDAFKEMLSKSVFAAAREDSRHVLNGVLMMIENSNATFIGTDGKRLARVNTSIDVNPEHKSNYLIPLKAVEEIVKSIDGDEAVKVSLMNDKIGIESGPTVMITKLLSGDYPDVERVIPKESTHKLTLHREELMILLKQVALFTTDKSHSVQFSLSSGELTLTATSSEIGDGKVSMPVDYSGEAFDIAFNPFFFHDILRHCKDETVNFAITTPHNPGLITDSTTANFVIMPMRLAPA
ncbi:DNA polymerase III subunit beta [Candidatus Neptunichlamydia sp. REUL1]|uniref:DNA polymerase III subunit beta n=1 Tax=Candidatus Neptunichlamydia sp. REUL1 TaxID=3064277 RepID=UPI002930C0A0|nr:DNA polymerase III subunit beta [Candidatus Neptunochlamydia sp. REUL1]